MFKKKTGITLIALVITIVVLLVLAGVVVNLGLGEKGIIGKAKNAADKYKQASENEQIEIAKYENEIDRIITGESRGTLSTEQLNQITEKINQSLYPNKSQTITSFSDTTTEEIYTVERDGWLYVRVGREGVGGTEVIYRNNMEVLLVNGTANIGTWSGVNSIYIPVKAGDVIKKTQNATKFITCAYLYYYEAE